MRSKQSIIHTPRVETMLCSQMNDERRHAFKLPMFKNVQTLLKTVRALTNNCEATSLYLFA